MKLATHRKRETCNTCLWWWDLYDTGERKCYNRDSSLFHQKTKDGCKTHEDQVHFRSKIKPENEED